jgi:hypothetical protein
VNVVEGGGQDQAAELAATLETARLEGAGAFVRRFLDLVSRVLFGFVEVAHDLDDGAGTRFRFGDEASAEGAGSAVTWHRAQMVLLCARGIDVIGIAKVAFTSEDHVRDVIHDFDADGFDSL